MIELLGVRRAVPKGDVKGLGDFVPKSGLPGEFTGRFMSVCVVGTDIYIAGGTNSAHGIFYNQFWRYDTVSETLTRLASLPAGRAGGAMWEWDGNIYYYSGVANGTNGVQGLYVYNPTINSWSTQSLTTAMPGGMGVCLKIGDEVWRFGGQNGSTFYTRLEKISRVPSIISDTQVLVGGAVHATSRTSGHVIGNKMYVPKGMYNTAPLYRSTMLEIDLDTLVGEVYPIDDIAMGGLQSLAVGGEIIILPSMGKWVPTIYNTADRTVREPEYGDLSTYGQNNTYGAMAALVGEWGYLIGGTPTANIWKFKIHRNPLQT